MKKILAATFLAPLALATSHTANASDIGLAASTYDWSGAYVGANVGATMDNVELERQTKYTGPGILPPATQDLINAAHDDMSANDNGFTGGISAGYNWQVEQVVFGIEADLNALSLSGTMKKDVTGVFDDLDPGSDLKVIDKVNYNIDAFGTLRGRLGFAIDNVMVYGTGGLAYGHMQADSEVYGQDSAGSTTWKTSESDWNLGWTVGGGIEYGIDRWSLGLEYLYVDLLPVDWQSPSRLDLAAEWNTDYSFSVLRATGKVRF